MTIRTDLTIDWDSSPRIIEVDIASSDLNAQDLYDTLRDEAAKDYAMEDDDIVDAGGKEYLDAFRNIVITVTLKNAKVKFADRTEWTTCSLIGNIVAVDTNGDPMSPIEPAAYVTIDRALDSSGAVIHLDTIEADQTTIKNDISTMQGDVSTINTDIGSIDTSIGGIETDVGSIETDLAYIKQIEQGRWKIVDYQMIFYDTDGVTPIRTFDLKNSSGQATEIDVYERIPV